MIHAQTRPGRFRPVLTMVLVTILFVLGWLGLEFYFAVTAKPNPTIDYGELAEEHVRASQADLPGEDVWPVLLDTTQLFSNTLADLKDDETGIVWGKGNYSFDAFYDYENAQEELQKQKDDSFTFNEEAFDELEAHRRMARIALGRWDETGIMRRLDEIAASGKAVRPMPDTTQTMMVNILLPELSTLRNMTRALCARMRIAREAGDWELYAKSLEHGLALGRIEMSQTTLIDRLVGVAIRSLMYDQLRKDLTQQLLPAEACTLVKDAIDRQISVPPVTHTFDAELLMELDAVQWVHDKRGRVILSSLRQLDYGSATGPTVINIASIVLPRRAQTEAWFREFNEKIKAYAMVSIAERAEQSRQGLPAEPAYVSTWKTMIQDMLVPAYGRFISSDDQLRTQEFGTRVMLAIERYHHANNALPVSLDQLTPDWLDVPATDPYSIDGDLLGYRVLPEPDENGRTYILYSIGYDGTDDNGNAPTENMPDALRSGYEGTDYVLTEPIR